MWVKETDYWYKDQAIDILERLEMFRDDILTEIEERTNENIGFLTEVLYDVEKCIERLKRYRD